MTMDHGSDPSSRNPGDEGSDPWSIVTSHFQGRENTSKDWLFPPPDAENERATYCLPSFPWYVMGVAVMLLSTFVDPVCPCGNQKPGSGYQLVAPMNTSPGAVAIGPPLPAVPTLFFPSGMLVLMPSGTFHAISPVFAFTATRLNQTAQKHGGCRDCVHFSSIGRALNQPG